MSLARQLEAAAQGEPRHRVPPQVVPCGYAKAMAVEKLSISLDEDVAAAARAAAEAEGMSLSAWLSRAAVEAAAIEAGLRAGGEFEAENGPFSKEERDVANEVLDRYSVGRR